MLDQRTRSWFAVLDGGLLGDISLVLDRAGLRARSLFLTTADRDVQLAGPWLVALDQAPDAPDKVMRIAETATRAVFWRCDDGEVALWRHLRGINMAQLPRWAAAGATMPPRGESPDTPVEQVMFRHWDPQVLAALLPCLDAPQFARILGPAREIAFVAPEYGGLRRVVETSAWPAPPPGLLSIRSDQVAALSHRRVEVSHRRIMAYLRDVAPDHTRDTSDDDLLYQVQYSESVGRDLGLESERAHAQWAFLMVTSKGHVAKSETVTRFIGASPASPDRQMEEVMRQTVAAARERDHA